MLLASGLTTPLRYDSQKQRLGHQLRLAGLNFFQDLHMALWDELPTGYASARWETCMGDAPRHYGIHPRHARGQDPTSCPSSSHPSYGSSHHGSAQAEAPGPSRGSPAGGRAHSGAEDHSVDLLVQQSFTASEAGPGGVSAQGVCRRQRPAGDSAKS